MQQHPLTPGPCLAAQPENEFGRQLRVKRGGICLKNNASQKGTVSLPVFHRPWEIPIAEMCSYTHWRRGESIRI